MSISIILTFIVRHLFFFSTVPPPKKEWSRHIALSLVHVFGHPSVFIYFFMLLYALRVNSLIRFAHQFVACRTTRNELLLLALPLLLLLANTPAFEVLL